MDSMDADRLLPPFQRRGAESEATSDDYVTASSTQSSTYIPSDSLEMPAVQRRLRERCIARLTDLSDQLDNLSSMVDQLKAIGGAASRRKKKALLETAEQVQRKNVRLIRSIERLELDIAGGVPDPSTRRAASARHHGRAPEIGKESKRGVAAALQALQTEIVDFITELKQAQPDYRAIGDILSDINKDTLQANIQFCALESALKVLINEEQSAEWQIPAPRPAVTAGAIYSNRGRLENLTLGAGNLCFKVLGRITEVTRVGSNIIYYFIGDLIKSLSFIAKPFNGPYGVEARRATDAHIRERKALYQKNLEQRLADSDSGSDELPRPLLGKNEHNLYSDEKEVVRWLLNSCDRRKEEIKFSLMHRHLDSIPDIHQGSRKPEAFTGMSKSTQTAAIVDQSALPQSDSSGLETSESDSETLSTSASASASASTSASTSIVTTTNDLVSDSSLTSSVSGATSSASGTSSDYSAYWDEKRATDSDQFLAQWCKRLVAVRNELKKEHKASHAVGHISDVLRWINQEQENEFFWVTLNSLLCRSESELYYQFRNEYLTVLSKAKEFLHSRARRMTEAFDSFRACSPKHWQKILNSVLQRWQEEEPEKLEVLKEYLPVIDEVLRNDDVAIQEMTALFRSNAVELRSCLAQRHWPVRNQLPDVAFYMDLLIACEEASPIWELVTSCPSPYTNQLFRNVLVELTENGQQYPFLAKLLAALPPYFKLNNLAFRAIEAVCMTHLDLTSLTKSQRQELAVCYGKVLTELEKRQDDENEGEFFVISGLIDKN